ncbi:MAG: DUF2911 domain-containing protein [Longimicrobiales bacterium]|nr:DUF2911 domain-containing protein [Longimicrobiales bacterium]
MSLRQLSALGLLVLIALPAHAQVQASPRSTLSTVIDGTTLEMEFHRPSARGRELFGGVVPWQVRWTPGANWATVLRVDREVRINGVTVPAGEYSLWMTPRPDRFTLSLEPETSLFHTAKPDSTDGQIHIAAEPRPTSHTEMLTWRVPVQRGSAAVLEFAWGETSVPYDVVVQPSEPPAMEAWEREIYVGRYAMTFAQGFGWPEKAELVVYEEDGRLRGRLPFPIHPDDELAWDLVPAGAGRFNAGLYRGDVLFNVELGANLDFELADDAERAVSVQISTADGMVWAEGVRSG